MTDKEFPLPSEKHITIYSKSGCKNCLLVKHLLKEQNMVFNVIDCDEFILEKKEDFLEFIKELIGKEYKSFPMIFDGLIFVGGFKEITNYIDKILDFDISF